LPPFPSWLGCTTNTSGYDFRKGLPYRTAGGAALGGAVGGIGGAFIAGPIGAVAGAAAGAATGAVVTTPRNDELR
jgi:outer membrane lipoprotein SlyB